MRTALAAVAFSTTILCASGAATFPRSGNNAPVCGQHGSATGTASFTSESLSDYHQDTFFYCHSFCQGTPGCVSFAFYPQSGFDNQNCQLYNVSTAGNFAPDDSSPWQFYDLSCDQSEQTCGVAGYDKVVAWAERQGVRSAEDCQQLCYPRGGGWTGCLSFGYGNGLCELYNHLAIDVVAPDPDSPYVFYDGTCNLNPGRTYLCGVAGNQPGTDYAEYDDVDSLLDCQDSCTLTDSCQAFAYDGTSCAITVATVQEWYTANASSSFKFYDYGCKLAPEELVCGVTGDSWGRYPVSTAQVGSVADCQSQCNSAAFCLSYGYNDGTCDLFEYSAGYQHKPDSTGSLTFYDAGCGSTSTTMPTTTMSTTAATATATDAGSTDAAGTADNTTDPATTTNDDNATATTDAGSSVATDDSATTTTDDSAPATTDDSATATTDDSGSAPTDDSATTTTDDSATTTTDDSAATATDDNATATTDDSGTAPTDDSGNTDGSGTGDDSGSADNSETTTDDSTTITSTADDSSPTPSDDSTTTADSVTTTSDDSTTTDDSTAATATTGTDTTTADAAANTDDSSSSVERKKHGKHHVHNRNVHHAADVHLSPRANSSLMCAQSGWSKDTYSFWSGSYSPTIEYCLTACQVQTGCMSFAYSAGNATYNGTCQLYKVAVSGNFAADSSSPYAFYDLGCVQRQQQECNVVGYDKMQSISESASTDLASCAATCLDQNQYGTCFSYGYGNGTCELYQQLVVDNVTPGASSPYVFYDLGCSVPTPTTTAGATVTVTQTRTITTNPCCTTSVVY